MQRKEKKNQYETFLVNFDLNGICSTLLIGAQMIIATMY
jgi:hypothetical protein